MKRVAQIAAAAALGACALWAVRAPAAVDSGSIAVSATVGDSCVISTAPLAFGAYAPLTTNASAALTGTSVLTVKCTGGSGAALGLSDGLYFSGTRQMKEAASASYLGYELYRDSAYSLRWGDTNVSERLTAPFFPFATTGSKTVTVYGRIPGGQSPSAGTYADTVTATVYF